MFLYLLYIGKDKKRPNFRCFKVHFLKQITITDTSLQALRFTIQTLKWFTMNFLIKVYDGAPKRCNAGWSPQIFVLHYEWDISPLMSSYFRFKLNSNSKQILFVKYITINSTVWYAVKCFALFFLLLIF